MSGCFNKLFYIFHTSKYKTYYKFVKFNVFSKNLEMKSSTNALHLIQHGTIDINSDFNVLPRPYKILKYSEDNEDILINEAITALKQNKAIALPTDTIYGIATLAKNDKAVKKLYSIKQRNTNKPIAICVGKISDIPKWSNVSVRDEILQGLLPGPVTILLKGSKNLNPLILPETTKLIGIRIPKHSFIQKLVLKCEEPLALTSANTSCQNSSHTIQEFEDIWSKLALIIDGGPLGHLDPLKLGSTVVDLSVDNCFKIIRPGCAENETKQFLIKNNFTEY